MTRPTFRREVTETVTSFNNFARNDDEPDNHPLLISEYSDAPLEPKPSRITLWISKILYRRVLGDELETMGMRRKSKDKLGEKTVMSNCCTPWKISTCILALLVLVEMIMLLLNRTNHEMITFIDGFPGLPRSTNSIFRRFGFALHAKANVTLQATTDPSQLVFVGPPSPEIDQAWEELVGDRYFKLLDSEVQFLDQDIELPLVEQLPVWKGAVNEAGSYGGIDMMHSLHCVNSLRKALSSDYYAGTEMLLLPGETMRLHLDHCLEQLRQQALCYADTTAVTLKPIITDLDDGRKMLTMLGETERLHVCRDAEPILNWVREQARTRGRVT
ncbi:Hypothetical protein R9X50_00266000 [Acrodontium crateriforme]|uniref:Uncharacterized protein n=1 Tax=Acrodontium crateriforme TaxID=150365 RepID=A0AAQ3R3N0_9PEZI|nr:Hypothetical protein R9X50_00266000 [Acrodontium crateriforme]